MGLDMYLEAKKHYYDNDKIAKQLRKVAGIVFDSGNLNYTKLSIEVGYWRKANQIHKWFVANVQDGKDDCEDYIVSRSQLKELKKLCQEVLDNHEKAHEILPTKDGFFFGGTDYDEYYFDDLSNTIKIIDKVLELHESWDIHYYSSW